MSTIKVSNLQNASAASPAIVLDANSRATLNGLSYPTEGSLSGRNRIINGDMRIDQRNAGASVTPTDAYTLDRWEIREDTDGAITAQQVSEAPAGFNKSLKITVTTADSSLAATQRLLVDQRIEGFNTADLDFGTAGAKTVTLSFWVRSSLTGTFAGSLVNNTNNRSYPYTYSISAANTWEYKTVTIAGDTSGTWETTTSAGIKVYFGLGVGSTYSGTAGAWAASEFYSTTGAVSVIGTLNATWQITGVQLEAGSVATPFERRSYGQELSLCQRYFFAVKASEQSDAYCRFVQGDLENTINFTSCYTLPVRMRVTPTLTTTGTASNYAIYHAGTITACSAVPTLPSGNPQTVVVLASVASGLTAGRGAQIMANNNNTAYLYYGAEL